MTCLLLISCDPHLLRLAAGVRPGVGEKSRRRRRKKKKRGDSKIATGTSKASIPGSLNPRNPNTSREPWPTTSCTDGFLRLALAPGGANDPSEKCPMTQLQFRPAQPCLGKAGRATSRAPGKRSSHISHQTPVLPSSR